MAKTIVRTKIIKRNKRTRRMPARRNRHPKGRTARPRGAFVNTPVARSKARAYGKDSLSVNGIDLVVNEQVAADKVYGEGDMVFASMSLDPFSIPRLSKFAGAFQRVLWTRFVVRITPMFPTTASGGYIAALVKDPDDKIPTGNAGIATLKANKPSAVGKWYQPTTLTFKLHNTVPLFTSPPSSGGDSRWTFPCQIAMLATGGSPGVAGSVMVEIEWAVRFMDPSIEDPNQGLSETSQYPNPLVFNGAQLPNNDQGFCLYERFEDGSVGVATTSYPEGSVRPLSYPMTFIANANNLPSPLEVVAVIAKREAGGPMAWFAAQYHNGQLALVLQGAENRTTPSLNEIPAFTNAPVYPPGTTYAPEMRVTYRMGTKISIPTGKFMFMPPSRPAERQYTWLSGEASAASMGERLMQLKL